MHVQGEPSKAGKQAYKSIVGNIPFLKFILLKTTDYAIIINYSKKFVLWKWYAYYI